MNLNRDRDNTRVSIFDEGKHRDSISPDTRFYLSRMVINDLMRESRTRFVILHLAPVLLAGVLVAIYASPLAALDVVHPEGILHVVVPLILILTQTLYTYSLEYLKIFPHRLFYAFDDTNR